MFQSLSRDSGRLNPDLPIYVIPGLGVSIPQSGFGAFELAAVYALLPGPATAVSIPQSGFGAFEPCLYRRGRSTQILFQSLSRDSGRLNLGP